MPLASKKSKGVNSDALNADITRQQWEDYKTRFYPIEQKVLTGLSPETQAVDMQARIDRTDQTVDSQFGTARGITDRNMARYGLVPTADQTRSENRSFGLNRDLTKIGAENATRTAAQDRTDKMMLDTIQTGRDIATGAATSASSAAGLYGQRKTANSQLAAQQKSQNNQDIGTAASLAYLAYLAW